MREAWVDESERDIYIGKVSAVSVTKEVKNVVKA